MSLRIRILHGYHGSICTSLLEKITCWSSYEADSSLLFSDLSEKRKARLSGPWKGEDVPFLSSHSWLFPGAERTGGSGAFLGTLRSTASPGHYACHGRSAAGPLDGPAHRRRRIAFGRCGDRLGFIRCLNRPNWGG